MTKKYKICKKDIAIWKRCVYTLNDRNKELWKQPENLDKYRSYKIQRGYYHDKGSDKRQPHETYHQLCCAVIIRIFIPAVL